MFHSVELNLLKIKIYVNFVFSHLNNFNCAIPITSTISIGNVTSYDKQNLHL